MKPTHVAILTALTAATFVGGGGTALSAAKKSDWPTSCQLPFLFNARVTQWQYPRGITPKEAADYATTLSQSGINLVLTEGHRSLVNDWPSKPEDIPQIAKEGGAETSVRATRIVVDACHAKGIRVTHHITSTFCTKAYLDAHPDWAQRDARTGEPLFFDMYGGLWLLCPNNPHFRADFFRLVADFTRRTGVDGWMVDEVEILPNWYSCGCEYCRTKFHKETGFTLPKGKASPVWENFDDPTWRAWLRFRMKSCGDFFVDLKKALDAAAPDQVLTGCVAGASETFLPQYWGMDAAELGRAANFPFYEAYCPNASPFYSWRRFAAEMLLYSAIARPHGTPALTLYYPTSTAELPVCWALCNVAGNRYWALNNGEPGFQPYQTDGGAVGFFGWERDQKHRFGPQCEIAEVALLFSKQTRDATSTSAGATLEQFANTKRNELGGRDLSHYVNEWAGWAETLVEANAPFAVIRDAELTARGLAPYKVLVLPDAQCLSDQQAAAVLAFVKRGGRVITTGHPAARNDTGAPRKSDSLPAKLRAAGTHLDDLPGSRSLMGYVFAGAKWSDPRDPAALRAIREAVASALPAPPWAIEAPVGVVGRAYRRSDGSVLVHLLNCSAAGDDMGTTLAEPGKVQPRFKPLTGVRVRIRADVAPEGATAEWFSPNGLESPIELAHRGDYFEAVVPTLTHYGVLHIKGPPSPI